MKNSGPFFKRKALCLTAAGALLVAPPSSAATEKPPSLAERLRSGKGCVAQDEVVNDDLDLHGAEIFCNVDLKRVTFRGKLNFADATFAKGLSIRQGVFKKQVDMSRIRVKQSFKLEDSVFSSAVEFAEGSFGGSFSIVRSTFGSTSYIKFDGMTAAQSILMRSVYFNGPVDFIHVTAGRSLHAQNIVVSAGPTKFNKLRVHDDVFLQQATFSGPGKVEFQGMAIGGDLKLNGAHFENRAGMTTFAGTSVAGKLHMAHVAFGALDLSGMSYGSITGVDEEAANGDENWKELLEHIAHAKFSGDAFKNLENYFEKTGYPDRADEVYIRFREEQRKKTPLSFPSAIWFYNVLSWAFVKYGAFSPLLLAILWVLGTIYFRSCPCDRKKKEEVVGKFSPAIYTLDLLLPIGDLNVASDWIPKGKGVIWMRFFKIAGWVLAPLGLAALTRVFR